MPTNNINTIQQQRHDTTDIWYTALNAVQPTTLINNAVSLHHDENHNTHQLIITNIHHQPTTFTLNDYNTILLLGVGKASIGMTIAMNQILQQHVNSNSNSKHPIEIQGIVLTKHGYLNEFKEQHSDHSQTLDSLSSYIKFYESNHPIPDDSSVKATENIISCIEKYNEKNTLIIFLLSGGASSLLEKPLNDEDDDGTSSYVTLKDIIEFNDIMHRTNVPIYHLNTLRKQLSAVKNGKLLKYGNHATWCTLILSDVIGDDLHSIGSAPTVLPSLHHMKSQLSCSEIIEKYQLEKKLSSNILKVLINDNNQNTITTSLNIKHSNILIGNNYAALEAAQNRARELHYNSLIITDRLSINTNDAAMFILSIAECILEHNQPISKPACLLIGGETVVNINNNDENNKQIKHSIKGGRCQQLALHAAIRIAEIYNKSANQQSSSSRSPSHTITLLAAGTDGVDHTDGVAGAIVDHTVMNVANEHKIDAIQYSRTHDSYTFFHKIDCMLNDKHHNRDNDNGAKNSTYHFKCGSTGTNVADVIVVLIS